MVGLGLDPAAVWVFEVSEGVAPWRSKPREPAVPGDAVRPVIADDEDVVYAHEVQLATVTE